jgi:hypothetical protein
VAKKAATESYTVPLPWLRLWTDFVHDPKVQMLPETMRHRYVMLLCYTGLRLIPTDDDAAVGYALRLSAKETQRTKAALIKAKLIGKDWKPLAWDRRQRASDHDAAERKRRQRERDKAERTRDTGASHYEVTAASRDSRVLEEEEEEEGQEQEEEHTQTARTRETGADAPGVCAGPDGRKDSKSRKPEPDGFAEFVAAYPPCSRDRDRPRAMREFRARVKEGHTSLEMIDGAKRYALQCDKTSRAGTQYVKSPANFLAEKLFLQPFPLPQQASELETKTHGDLVIEKYFKEQADKRNGGSGR